MQVSGCVANIICIDHMLVSVALFFVFHVICAMQIILATQPDAYINALLNTNLRQLVNVF